MTRITELPTDSAISQGDALPLVDITNNITKQATIAQLGVAIRNSSYSLKTTTYALTTSDGVVECSGTFTITLPSAVGITAQQYTIKNSGTGIITLATTSSQTIDGFTTRSLAQYDSYTLVSNGTNWIII